MHGEERDVLDFRAFSCRAWVRVVGKANLLGSWCVLSFFSVLLVQIGFANKMSSWVFWIPEDKKIMKSNQVKFSEHEFPLEEEDGGSVPIRQFN